MHWKWMEDFIGPERTYPNRSHLMWHFERYLSDDSAEFPTNQYPHLLFRSLHEVRKQPLIDLPIKVESFAHRSAGDMKSLFVGYLLDPVVVCDIPYGEGGKKDWASETKRRADFEKAVWMRMDQAYLGEVDSGYPVR